MKKYIGKRIVLSVVTLFVIVLILFVLMQWMPGSPFNDEKLSFEQQIALREKYGLNDSVFVQFFRYVKNMLTGDFGESYTISKNTPVSVLLKNRLPISLLLGAMSIALGTITGLVLGIFAALKHNTIFDTAATFFSVVGVSIPSTCLLWASRTISGSN